MSITAFLNKFIKSVLYRMHARGVNKAFKKNKEIRALVGSNAEFKDIHKGQRCFIVGNGPSLNDEDLSLLENEYVFTVNKIANHPSYESMRSNYHFWADPAFFNLSPDNEDDMELLKRFEAIKTDKVDPVCFVSQYGYDMVKRFGLDKKLNVRFFYSDLFFRDGEKKDIDFTRPVFALETVVQFCIQMAIYMGFTEIYLLGCDNTYIVGIINTILEKDVEEYSYKVDESEKRFIKKSAEQRKNGGIESSFSSCARMLHIYRELYTYCSDRNIKLVNCSSKTIIDSIPRASLSSVLSDEKK